MTMAPPAAVVAADAFVVFMQQVKDKTNEVLGFSNAGPVRTFITHGTPAVDCEMAALRLVRMLPHVEGNPFTINFGGVHRDGGANIIYVAEFELQVWRRVVTMEEDGSMPPADEREANALCLLYDALLLGQLWKCEVEALADEHKMGLIWQDLEELDPEGGYGGWRFLFTVDLVGGFNQEWAPAVP